MIIKENELDSWVKTQTDQGWIKIDTDMYDEHTHIYLVECKTDKFLLGDFKALKKSIKSTNLNNKFIIKAEYLKSLIDELPVNTLKKMLALTLVNHKSDLPNKVSEYVSGAIHLSNGDSIMMLIYLFRAGLAISPINNDNWEDESDFSFDNVNELGILRTIAQCLFLGINRQLTNGILSSGMKLITNFIQSNNSTINHSAEMDSPIKALKYFLLAEFSFTVYKNLAIDDCLNIEYSNKEHILRILFSLLNKASFIFAESEKGFIWRLAFNLQGNEKEIFQEFINMNYYPFRSSINIEEECTHVLQFLGVIQGYGHYLFHGTNISQQMKNKSPTARCIKTNNLKEELELISQYGTDKKEIRLDSTRTFSNQSRTEVLMAQDCKNIDQNNFVDWPVAGHGVDFLNAGTCDTFNMRAINKNDNSSHNSNTRL